jgi:hypothetical protein
MAQNIVRVGYGLTEPLPALAPYPIRANRVPNTADKGYPIGQLWVYVAGNAAYVLTSIVNNLANWQLLETGGGAGVFASLVVTPGPISLTGTTTVNTAGAATTSIGNAAGGAVSIVSPVLGLDSSAAGAITIGSSLVAGTLSEGGALQTGAISLGISTAGQTINVGNAVNVGAQVVNIANGASGANSTVNILSGNGTAGTQTANIANGSRASAVNIATNAAAANAVIVGSLNAASTTTIRGGTGLAGGIVLNAQGFTQVVAATDTQASPSAASTLNANVGAVTFTGFTTAAAAKQVFTITNSEAALNSQILATVANEGANDAQMYITRINRAVGSFAVTVVNDGAAALNGDLTLTFWILN